MTISVLASLEEPRRRLPRSRCAPAIILTALLGLPLGAQAVQRAIDFLPAVQSLGEGVRINVANLKNQEGGAPPDPCIVTFAFYDAGGNLVGQTQAITLQPGASVSVASTLFSATGGAILQRGRITFAGVPKSGLDKCGGVGANYEVFDTASNLTHFMNPGVIHGFNPQPDPPGVQDSGQ